jgi:catechol 2,3-dioxygenase-like lactoylglutathione lyase family enzyme
MQLNHLDLQVRDVQRCVSLLETYFDFELRSSRSSPAIAILSDRAGFTLVLQRMRDEQASYPEGFHIGFLRETPEEVHAFHARARAAGLNVSDIIENGRGTLVYFKSDDLCLIEVSCHNTRKL